MPVFNYSMRAICLWCIVAVSGVMAGCDNDDNGVCEAIVGCGSMAADECADFYGAADLSEECKEAIKAAPCEEHGKAASSYKDTCFESCTGSSRTCKGAEKIEVCVEGMAVIFLCEKVCLESFTGHCGKNYQIEEVDEDQCWCRQ